MGGEKARRRRCATYTRKSSEEGLEQDFNSLDAQREACEAYIKSQAGEGWKPVKTRYDDGGFSGGNVDRPGLQQLLADIDDGKIDIVVVYKVDRLTRSLADFAKIVEVLDAHEVSFVSVTQQFNTTTSMGRLTLNMLLSFAQFEREVTGERIRDKIAASKRKGLWMGGLVPLGYEADGRTLKIVEAEARIVRKLFRLYLEEGTVRRVKEEADRLGFKSKARKFKDGSTRGGLPLGRGHIHRILSNPIYIGRIRHEECIYEGQHDPIVDRDTWKKVQKQLADHTPNRPPHNSAIDHNPLRGKLFDEANRRMTPKHTVKKGRRYRYYVRGTSTGDSSATNQEPRRGLSLPAREVESAVENAVRTASSSYHALIRSGRGIASEDVASLSKALKRALEERSPFEILERALITEDGITLYLKIEAIAGEPARTLELSVPLRVRRRGCETRLALVGDRGTLHSPSVDVTLVGSILRARAWLQELVEGRATSLRELGREHQVSDQYVGALLPLAFLAPHVLKEILTGEQPLECTADHLIKRMAIPLSWSNQIDALNLEHRE